MAHCEGEQDLNKITSSDNFSLKSLATDISEKWGDIVEEWPEMHSFYFVKYRFYEDQQLTIDIDKATKDLHNKKQARYPITQGLRAKRSERAGMIQKLESLTSQEKAYTKTMREKKEEIEPLNASLYKFRRANIPFTEQNPALCCEVELDQKIKDLEYRREHEVYTVREKKRVMNEMKQLEGSRDKVKALEVVRRKIQDSLPLKEVMEDTVKLLELELDEVKKKQKATWTEMKSLEEAVRGIDDEIKTLQKELDVASQARDGAYQTLERLKKQCSEMNTACFDYRYALSSAKILASNKDKAALQELSHSQLERFMCQWNSSKEFRQDYEKRNYGNIKLLETPPVEAPDQVAAEDVDYSKSENVMINTETDHVNPVRAVEEIISEEDVIITSPDPQQKHERDRRPDINISSHDDDGKTLEEMEAADCNMICPLNHIEKSPGIHVVSGEKNISEDVRDQNNKEEQISREKLDIPAESVHETSREEAQAEAAAKADRKRAKKTLKKRETKARKKAEAVLNSIRNETMSAIVGDMETQLISNKKVLLTSESFREPAAKDPSSVPLSVCVGLGALFFGFVIFLILHR